MPLPRSLALPLLVATCLGSSPGSAAPPREVGQAVQVSGSVRGSLSPTPPLPVAKDDPIYLDMRITAGRQSTARFHFDPDGTFILEGVGEVVFDEKTVRQAARGFLSQLTVVTGALLFYFRTSGQIGIASPHMVLEVDGTSFFMQVDPFGTLVGVGEGEVTVQAVEPWIEEEELRPNGEPVTVPAGSHVYVPRGGRPTQLVPIPPELEVFLDSPLLYCCDFRIDPP